MYDMFCKNPNRHPNITFGFNQKDLYPLLAIINKDEGCGIYEEDDFYSKKFQGFHLFYGS